MILYRPMKQEDITQVTTLLSSVNQSAMTYMSHFHHAMVLDIDDHVKGIALYKLIDQDLAKMSLLLIDQGVRGLAYGDGLVKTLLNTAVDKGIYRVYVDESDINEGFYHHMGFNPLEDQDPIHDLVASKEPGVKYYVQLPEFFDTACHSKRKAHETT